MGWMIWLAGKRAGWLFCFLDGTGVLALWYGFCEVTFPQEGMLGHFPPHFVSLPSETTC